MVSRLVNEGAGNRTSEEEIVNGSEGPDISERVQMVMAISRPTTAQMVLGREALYLPDDHPLLRQIQSSVAIQGRVLANLSGTWYFSIFFFVIFHDFLCYFTLPTFFSLRFTLPRKDKTRAIDLMT